MKWSGLRLSRKVIGIGALALALLAAGAFGVNQALAQDAAPTTPEQPGPFGPGMGPRGGMRGFGPRDGGILADYHDVMLQPVADALGLSVDELNAELAAGKRLWEIAEDKGVDAQTLADAKQAGREAAIAQAVRDGVITQEQADQMLSRQFGGPRGGCPGWNGGQAPAPTDTGTSA